MSKKKKKKEKIVYIDDGSTVADMSGVGRKRKSPSANPNVSHGKEEPRWKAILNTYFDSVKMMLLPMLVVIGIISVAFLILWIAFGTKA